MPLVTLLVLAELTRRRTSARRFSSTSSSSRPAFTYMHICSRSAYAKLCKQMIASARLSKQCQAAALHMGRQRKYKPLPCGSVEMQNILHHTEMRSVVQHVLVEA